ncbi:PREDICTED: EKC/KEOPS complex subunit TPRKB isoform X3 [Hipposideros armiger]|uniref:EKC/KEOPS complex subunit TPRKB isoform X3 n=1 Tax=Hipposideros armiger TaxID=186990 RepID=A0A8B7PRU0_HIPAR|nr:PREDICTED: EKC/KEOPS complex subunit TPRKB isoform X3 [Hipposideros armiger]
MRRAAGGDRERLRPSFRKLKACFRGEDIPRRTGKAAAVPDPAHQFPHTSPLIPGDHRGGFHEGIIACTERIPLWCPKQDFNQGGWQINVLEPANEDTSSVCSLAAEHALNSYPGCHSEADGRSQAEASQDTQGFSSSR